MKTHILALLAVACGGLTACESQTYFWNNPGTHVAGQPITLLRYDGVSTLNYRAIPITDLIPYYEGGAVESFILIEGTLPAGLMLDAVSGKISGIITTEKRDAVTVRVKASNGNTTFATAQIDFNIKTFPLVYTPASLAYTIGLGLVPAAQPQLLSGMDATFAVSGPQALPKGLSINFRTGQISGAPTELMTATTFTVQRLTIAGTDEVKLPLVVNDVPAELKPLSALTYAAPAAMPVNSQLSVPPTFASPADASRIVHYYLVTEAPDWITMDAQGVLAFAPPLTLDVAHLKPMHVAVTATTANGVSQTANFVIGATAIAPAPFAYFLPPTLPRGLAVTPRYAPVPGVGSIGGKVDTYSQTGMPPWLSLLGDGTITGNTLKPTDLGPVQVTITAKNGAGSKNAVINIQVVDLAPTSLVYVPSTGTYTYGTPITPAKPVISGLNPGAVVVYTVPAGQLPAGLSLQADGTLVGTPTEERVRSPATFTATTSAGSASFVFWYVSIYRAPSVVPYQSSPIVYNIGLPITPDCPDATKNINTLANPIEVYAVKGSLPAGLSLDPVTGCISGTPTVSGPMQNYLITESNSGGAVMTSLSMRINQFPVIANVTANVIFNTPLDLILTATDPDVGDTVILTAAVGPTLHGQITTDPAHSVAGTLRVHYVPETGFRGGDSFLFEAKDASGAARQAKVSLLIESSVNHLQPSLAIRASGCIMCHAKVDSNVITDFGYLGDGKGLDYFLLKNFPNRRFGNYNIYGDHAQNWRTSTIQGNVIIPANATLPPGTLDGWGMATGPTLKSYLTNLPAADGLAAPQLKVVEASSLYIGAPTAARILAVAGAFDPSSPTAKYIPHSPSSPGLSGLTSKSSKGITIFQNSDTVELGCFGDLVLNGPIVLKSLKLRTDGYGCRIYATGTIFISGEITYLSASAEVPVDPNRNLQLASARGIMLGLGANPEMQEAGMLQNYYPPADTLLGRLVLPNSASGIMSSDINYTTQTRDPSQSITQKLASMIADYNAFPAGSILDATNQLPDRRAVSFERLLLDAPNVQSRYQGNFSGVVISEIAIFSLGQFKFKFDPVFSNVPVLPLLDEADYLQVVSP